MEASNHIPPQNEMDVVGFFQLLGRMFSKLGKAIKDFFHFLFQFFIYRPFVFYKRYTKLILGLLLLALILGIIADSMKKPVYKADILISPNYDSGKELYTRIDMYNTLAAEGNYEKLAEELGISEDTVSHYLGFEIQPNTNERILLRSYDEFSQLVDSSMLDELPYNTYKETFKQQKFDYPQHIISVTSDDPQMLAPLNGFFENLLMDDPLFTLRKYVTLSMYDSRIKYIKQTIAQTDSLRQAIDRAISHSARTVPASGSNNVIIGGPQLKFPEQEYDLFLKKRKLIDLLTNLKQSKIELTKIFILNSKFPDYAPSYNPMWKNYKLTFVLFTVILLLIAFYLVDLLTYLNRLYKQSQNEPQK